MKKVKSLLLSALIISACGLKVSGQVDDTKAKGILDGVSAKMKSYTSMKIEFSYSMVNAKTNVNEAKTGVILIKGSKYKLEMGGQTVFCDGKTVWTYLKDDNEVNINNVSTQDDSPTPANILNNYAANYKAKWIKESVEGGKTITIIDLTPIKGKSYYKVRINIDKTAQQITSSIVYDKNGTTYTYSVSSFTANVAADDSMFTFNKASYPNVETNDMR